MRTTKHKTNTNKNETRPQSKDSTKKQELNNPEKKQGNETYFSNQKRYQLLVTIQNKKHRQQNTKIYIKACC